MSTVHKFPSRESLDLEEGLADASRNLHHAADPALPTKKRQECAQLADWVFRQTTLKALRNA